MSPEKIYQDLLPQKFGRWGKIWVLVLLTFCLLGVFAYFRQLRYGLSVTGMGDYVSWGIYISNFVFFVAISLVGSLITAVLRLTQARWSTPLTRIAEMIAVSAIIFAALIIIVDMGRPDRFVNVLVYGRIQSPILWDVIVIVTYLVLGVLLLYMSLLPDLAIVIKHRDQVQRWIYSIAFRFGSFWKGTPEQVRLREKGINVLVIAIIPVALAIHTVTSWLFAITYRPGWDSTNFGAYFVSGAFLVGAAAVVVAMYIFRRFYCLQEYITTAHFNHMGKLVVMLALLYVYFNINEYLVPAFKMKKHEEEHLRALFTGDFSVLFWLVIVAGMILPIIVMLFPAGRKPLPMFIVSSIIVVGAWFKRFLIVTPTLLHPFLPMSNIPETYKHYYPTWEEWAITGGTLAGALLLITLMARIFPIVPVEETIREKVEQEARQVALEREKRSQSGPAISGAT